MDVRYRWVINRIFTLGNVRDGKHQEVIHFVIIARVVTVLQPSVPARPVQCNLRDNLCTRPGTSRSLEIHFTTSVLVPRSGPARHIQRVYPALALPRPEWWRVGPNATETEKTLARVCSAPLTGNQRAAAMRQPAHDELILANQLLAVNTRF